MYCNKCGKYISQGTKCDDCARAEYYASQAQQAQQPSYNYANGNPYARPNYNCEPEPKNRMYGFGKALTSTILGFVGFIWSYIAFGEATNYWGDEELALVLILMGLPFIIIPLIFGIQSIKVFTRRKNLSAKPIATLILGISGLVMSGFGALISLSSMMSIFPYLY